MKRCGTQGYDRDAFGSSPYNGGTLQRLLLSGNNLTTLERRGFRNLDDLQELYVNTIIFCISINFDTTLSLPPSLSSFLSLTLSPSPSLLLFISLSLFLKMQGFKQLQYHKHLTLCFPRSEHTRHAVSIHTPLITHSS